MSRLKKSSEAIAAARQRSTALKSIDANLDLGSGLTAAAYDAKIAETQAKLDAYNDLLSQADAALNDVQSAEKDLSDLSGRMLAGVSVKYGKDSNEYEKAGGTRASERAKAQRSPTPPAK